jgi:hypothetical protein
MSYKSEGSSQKLLKKMLAMEPSRETFVPILDCYSLPATAASIEIHVLFLKLETQP